MALSGATGSKDTNDPQHAPPHRGPRVCRDSAGAIRAGDCAVKALRSKSYLAASRDQPCTLRIPGICNGDWSTTVPAHIRDRHTGRSIKASDCSIVDACATCHRRLDGQDGRTLGKEEWLYYVLRGIQETLESRIRRGIVFKGDKA
jgi:Protein of unknown function (DUF1364)